MCPNTRYTFFPDFLLILQSPKQITLKSKYSITQSPNKSIASSSNTELTVQCINRKGYNTNTKESKSKNQTLGRRRDEPERKDRECENEKQTNVSARTIFK